VGLRTSLSTSQPQNEYFQLFIIARRTHYHSCCVNGQYLIYLHSHRKCLCYYLSIFLGLYTFFKVIPLEFKKQLTRKRLTMANDIAKKLRNQAIDIP